MSGSCTSASSSSPKLDVDGAAQGNHRGKADVHRRGEVEHRRANRAGLRLRAPSVRAAYGVVPNVALRPRSVRMTPKAPGPDHADMAPRAAAPHVAPPCARGRGVGRIPGADITTAARTSVPIAPRSSGAAKPPAP